MSIKTPKPRAGSTGRGTLKGEARDNPMTGAAGRATTKATPMYPGDGNVALTPKVEKGYTKRGPGSPYDTKMVNRQRQGPAVREGGGSGKPAGSTASPFRSKGGNGPGNSTKNPKAN